MLCLSIYEGVSFLSTPTVAKPPVTVVNRRDDLFSLFLCMLCLGIYKHL